MVLAVFRAPDLVSAAIERVLSSTEVNLELVVVDDGSGDGTRAAIEAAIAGDRRARLVALDANRGLGNARRVGFSAARGRYVWNVDVDDDWPVDAPARLVRAAERADADIVLASAVRRSIGGFDRPLAAPDLGEVIDGPAALGLLLSGRVTGHLWNKLIARRRLEPDIYTDAVIHSDLVMVVPLLARAERVVATSDVVYVYRETPGSNIRSRTPRGDYLDEAWRRLEEEARTRAPHLIDTPDYRRFREHTIVLSLLRDAVRGDYPAAESRRRLSEARSRVSVRGVMAVARAGQRRDALLLVLSVVSPPLFRRVMRRGSASAARNTSSSAGMTASGE